MKKNILIYSSPNDISTNNVIDWIDYFGANPIRINGNDFFKKKLTYSQEINNKSSNVSIDFKEIKFETKLIHSVWFRKDRLSDIEDNVENISDLILKNETLEYLHAEYSKGREAFSHSLKKTKGLGKRIFNPPSKTDMLLKAKKVGLDIPETLITNRKKILEKFLTKNERVITKPISDAPYFSKEVHNVRKEVFLYTELITKKYLSKIPDIFFPSLFQEALNKEFEIRTFFLNDFCYSMAIFSQLDDQTNVDFRMYNTEKKNRTVPYLLPKNIEKKVSNLMTLLDLKTGSLDLIKTKEGRFVFLEVNPWGQYGMTSTPCNYNLDEAIANFLVSDEK